MLYKLWRKLLHHRFSFFWKSRINDTFDCSGRKLNHFNHWGNSLYLWSRLLAMPLKCMYYVVLKYLHSRFIYFFLSKLPAHCTPITHGIFKLLTCSLFLESHIIIENYMAVTLCFTLGYLTINKFVHVKEKKNLTLDLTCCEMDNARQSSNLCKKTIWIGCLNIQKNKGDHLLTLCHEIKAFKTWRGFLDVMAMNYNSNINFHHRPWSLVSTCPHSFSKYQQQQNPKFESKLVLEVSTPFIFLITHLYVSDEWIHAELRIDN